ncbi:MAG: hypothetical protein KFB96_06600 [Thiocapsa sp.]|uniref:hypothetical protein n=1 Tax=Thiocapsa sp. TaxID=2024551 RepID=UPI001BD1681F|nr:hypothetical protein [Thiocapsa sp.]QVL50129.1 MAG: hypothetical protein KFB96_06600 [Thiocapsa sp.]
MTLPVLAGEVFGLVRPSVDAHTLGINHLARLLRRCGYPVVIADRSITDAANRIQRPEHSFEMRQWLRQHRITRLGLSYRLDPQQAAEVFGRLYYQLHAFDLLGAGNGKLRGIYFGGLPAACERIERRYGRLVPVFRGDETSTETLLRLGVPRQRIPADLLRQSAYDDDRLAFGRALLSRGAHRRLSGEDRSGYPGFGTRADHLVRRVDHAVARGQSPLMRAHVGPFAPDRHEAIKQFIAWVETLARSGHLDILSIGTSQLTQERFGEDWQDRPNGGGVPINSEDEYQRIWQAGRPMLVRTYAGTQRIPALAQIHERALNIAWHALSFWWFSRIDGRGPHPVRRNLIEHLQTLDFIAATGKPFEPNIPHHFSFRGGDDVTYVLSAVLAARTAKRRGVRYFVLQNMLNTPKYTLGVQDLAKARAMLRLVRELEDGRFRVILQPRAGLDYFSPDLDQARVQLAAVSALMDDIEPGNDASPAVVHVVSFCEAAYLATPVEIDESIQITRQSIASYRALRRAGKVPDMTQDPEVQRRTEQLVADVRQMLAAIESVIPDPYSAEGLYRIFAAGFLVAPYLWEEREEFSNSVAWQTDVVDGGVSVVDDAGLPIPISVRAASAAAAAAQGSKP